MTRPIAVLDRLGPNLAWLQATIVVAVAVAAALVAHAVLIRIADRATRRTVSTADDAVVARTRRPLRWIFVAVALAVALRFVPMGDAIQAMWRQLFGFVVPALLGWMALALLGAVQDIVALRTDLSADNNLEARRRRTRSTILGRIGGVFIVFVTICLMLLSVPGIRSIGVTLMASAGIAGLVVGAAAQPALKNIIAGVQMAFTEPIRIDDIVIVAGEWGRIEDIRLTYVVVKLWDERRLVVPVSKFLEDSFQNWTRDTSQLLGSVLWYLDPATDIDRLRTKLEAVVKADPKWDGRFCNLQVTDAKADSIEVRALMTAADASTAFDLRCDVREAVLAFLRTDMPEAFPAIA